MGAASKPREFLAMGSISEELRRQMIAEAAYFRAEQRGFANGDPATDWIEAEDEADAELSADDDSLGGLQERLTVANEWHQGLRERLFNLSGDAKGDCESELEKLAKLRDSFRKQIKGFQGKSGRAAAKAKQQAEHIWDEIASIMDFASRSRR
jgi:hypothetical protein